jgi:acyl-CoA thioesterase II
MTANTILEHVALDKISENEYVSRFHPGWLGNIAMIAYGGCTLAIGVSAACQTVSDRFHLYSSNGNYLGPAQTDRKYFCKVTRLRDTRTFATRYVEVSQELDDGGRRVCMSMLADFQVQEPGTMLSYSAQPSMQYPGPEEGRTFDEHKVEMVKAGKISQDVADAHSKIFATMSRTFESHVIPQSIFHQTLGGMAKHLPTRQDELPLTSRTTAEWLRSRGSLLKTQSENVAAIAFNIDGALSFLPLVHEHKGLEDAGPCSSLDFAVRIFSNAVDLNQWHLKELKTHHGSNGRTYSEARIWDDKSNLVAVMTQTNILRPKPPPKAKAAL